MSSTSSLIEEIEVRLDTVIANRMRQEFERNMDKSMKTVAKSSEDAAKKMEEAFGKKMANKFGESALAMGAVGLAINQASRALNMFIKDAVEGLAPKNELGMALSATEQRFSSIRDIVNDTNLNSFEKLFSTLGLMAGSDNLFEGLARMDAMQAGSRNRDLSNAARMSLVEADMARSGTGSTNLIASSGVSDKFAEIDKKRREAAKKGDPQFFADEFAKRDAILEFENRLIEADRREAEIRASNAETMMELERTKQEGLTEIAESNAQRRAEIAEMEAASSIEAYERLGSVAGQVFNDMASTAVDALFAVAEGRGADFEAIADRFLKEEGRQLVGMGIRHSLEAAALGVMSFGANPQAAALAGVALAEIASGSAMMSGSLLVPNHAAGGGSIGKAMSRASSQSDDFAGGAGSVSADRGFSGTEFGDGTIIININGGVHTGDEAGRAIVEAIDKYRRRTM